MSTRRGPWSELDRALQVLQGQVRRTGLDQLTERELTDAAEEEKQARRRERRERGATE